jgi:hypothetical protein
MFRTKLQPYQKLLLFWTFIIAFAEILHMASLYQLEIIMIWVSEQHYTFEFPFYIGGEISVWVARDFWYLMSFVSRIIGYFSLYKMIGTMLNYKYGIKKINLLTNIKRIITDSDG